MPLFQGFNDEAVGFVISQLQTAVFDVDDVIYSAGDQAAEMYLVVSGTVGLRVDVSLQPGKTAASAAATIHPEHADSGKRKSEGDIARGLPTCAERGDVFGELCMFPEAHGTVRRETAVAETWVEAYCLTADRVEKIRASYPEIVVRLREYCAMRALEIDFYSDSHAGASAVRGHCLGTQPCRMRRAAEGIRRTLVSHAETDILLPAAGSANLNGARRPGQRLSSVQTEQDHPPILRVGDRQVPRPAAACNKVAITAARAGSGCGAIALRGRASARERRECSLHISRAGSSGSSRPAGTPARQPAWTAAILPAGWRALASLAVRAAAREGAGRTAAEGNGGGRAEGERTPAPVRPAQNLPAGAPRGAAGRGGHAGGKVT